jgi:TP901 family phage tail tape measure protein
MSNNLVQTISLKDNGYSQGVKSAKQALQELGKQNGVVNNSFRNTSKELNSAKKFYGQLKTEYDRLSEDAKRSEFGKAMHAQIEQTKADLKSLYEQTARTRKELADMQEQANKKVNGGGKSSSFDLGGMLGGGAKGILKKAGTIGLAIGAIDTLKSAIADNINYAKDFEKASSGVKALTGASEDTMKKFKQYAIDLGGTTTQTASQVMDAFGMIGSQSPELLKSADSLAKVTKNAIILSEAAGIDLADASKALTGILNQFGISANKSKDIINMLAAASQQGAGNIEYLNGAIKNCGSVAGALNIQVNEVIGELEMLAQAGVDSSSAGNNLKNIMLILEQSTDRKLKPSVVGLTQALVNLSKMQKSSVELTKMFGKENVASALSLIKNAEGAKKMSEAITGTNTAIEQQKINNDNLEGSLKNLSSKWEAFNLSINQSNGNLKETIDLIADLVEWFTKLNNIPTTIGGKEVEKINKQYGGANAYQEKASRGEQIKAYNLRKKAIEAEYKEADRLYKEYQKGAKDAKRGKAVQQQQAALATGQLLKRNALKVELDAYIKSGKDFFYPTKNTPTKTTTTTTDTTTDKEKKAKQTYDEKISQIEAELAIGHITEKKAVEEKISAINQYISALTSTTVSAKKNKALLDKLSAKQKALEKELVILTEQEADAKAVQDADKNYVTTIAKLNRARENKWISETDYQNQYISAIRDLIKGYQKVTNMSEDMVKVIGEKQKEIKDFELKQSQNKAITQYLASARDIDRIYNDGSPERQAPTNSAYKAHETAYINLTQKAKSIDFDNILSNPDYKPTQADLDWLKDYKQYLKDNVNLLGQMYEDVQDLDSAVKHAKKITLVYDIQTDIDNILEGNSTEQVSDLVKKYKEDLKSIDFELEFDENEFLDKIKELGTQTAIPIHIEPTYDTVDELSEIVEKFAPDTPDYKALKGFKKKFDKDIENLLNYVNNWQFPDAETVFGKGDASNFSIVNNPSYYKLNKQYTKFDQGHGRLNDNLMDDRITQKMNEDLDKYLQKYRDIEELYVKMRQESEEKGLDFTFENSQIDQELSDLESRIASLHSQIQDRLTFQLRIEGAQDALDGLGGFANIGASLASLPDTLDNISDSSNDAAAAFQYFGVIVGSIQDIIDAIKISMEVYKGVQDLLTASTVASALGSKEDAGAKTADIAVSEASTATKTTEAGANKALEASILDLAAAEIFAAHASIPFAGVPIATSNVDAMMGTMATVHATSAGLQAFANGGIVGGDSFSGDKTLIRANKGEMILNNQQQGNLFALLDGVVGTNQGGGKVKFEISGDNLVGVLNNHSRMKSKVGNRLR